MKRETENTILLLVGLSVALIVATGVFTRYVKPTLLPWLVLTAALLIGLALMGMVSDIRREKAGHDADDGHSHRGGVVWLLAAVPMLAILRVSTPAPVSMMIESPTFIPVPLLTVMVVSPLCAAAASPELERPST